MNGLPCITTNKSLMQNSSSRVLSAAPTTLHIVRRKKERKEKTTQTRSAWDKEVWMPHIVVMYVLYVLHHVLYVLHHVLYVLSPAPNTLHISTNWSRALNCPLVQGPKLSIGPGP